MSVNAVSKINSADKPVAILSVAPRSYALDTLRGIAILLMVLSGLEPFGVLPAWMYHGQEPPPSHIFDSGVAGITWVDLVFPFFIFSMGAAFPLAFAKKIASGAAKSELFWQTVKRGMFLLAFAIYNWHFNPHNLSDNPTVGTCFLALGAFFLMFPMWGRFPWKMSNRLDAILKCGAWAVAIIVLAALTYPDKSGFSLYHSNIILFILADLALFGSLIWLITRNSIEWRLALMGLFLAIYVSSGVETGWINAVGSSCEIPFVAGGLQMLLGERSESVRWLHDLSWMFRWACLKYVFIIIPATIIGDMLVMHLRNSDGKTQGLQSLGKYIATVVIIFVIAVSVLAGLKARWSAATFIASCVLCTLGFAFLRKPADDWGRLYKKMYLWGVLWLVLGLLFEPYEGGIKKDPSTLSYLFVTAGLATLILVALSIIIDVFKKYHLFRILIENGQNPMIAYAGSSNLILPVLGLLGVLPQLMALGKNMPWLGFLVALCLTFCLAIVVSTFTRLKIFLRT